VTLLPVIARELRSQARQRFTFTLRELGVVGLLIWGFIYSTESSLPQNLLGLSLFRHMHMTLFFTIWILVPFSAADCLSRERREGTLGLLFLTPLKPTNIVIAKSVAHGLRAASLVVAVLPMLTIPILLGGVSWQHATLAGLTEFSALCWSLAAALLASSATRSALRATVWAVVLSLCGLFMFTLLSGGVALWISGRWTRYESLLEIAFRMGLELNGVGRGFPLDPRMIPGGIWNLIFQTLALSAIVSFLAFTLAAILAAWRIRRNWREEPSPLWMQKTQRAFCTPVIWTGLFKRWMRRLLDRNPIGWLERRTWTGRLVTWGWFAVIVSVYSAVLTDNNFFRHSSNTQTTMAWLLMGSITAGVAGSFRRERETGVLELLLVTPMTTKQIISGRLRGLWGQFLPAVGLLLFIWGYFASIFNEWKEFSKIFFFAGTFLSLPIIGLYFSVRSRSFIGAFLLTLIFSLFLPRIVERLIMFLASLVMIGTSPFDNFETTLGCRPGAVIIQFLLAAWFGALLYRRLDKRDFPMERVPA
jgi:ABC-type transport system involved in multi-copper enzyme maturation permease subunit